jgi:hypothetical protein
MAVDRAHHISEFRLGSIGQTQFSQPFLNLNTFQPIKLRILPARKDPVLYGAARPIWETEAGLAELLRSEYNSHNVDVCDCYSQVAS